MLKEQPKQILSFRDVQMHHVWFVPSIDGASPFIRVHAGGHPDHTQIFPHVTRKQEEEMGAAVIAHNESHWLADPNNIFRPMMGAGAIAQAEQKVIETDKALPPQVQGHQE